MNAAHISSTRADYHIHVFRNVFFWFCFMYWSIDFIINIDHLVNKNDFTAKFPPQKNSECLRVCMCVWNLLFVKFSCFYNTVKYDVQSIRNSSLTIVDDVFYNTLLMMFMETKFGEGKNDFLESNICIFFKQRNKCTL